MNEKTVTLVTRITDNQKRDLVGLYQNEFWCQGRALADVDVMLQNSDVVLGLVTDTGKLVAFVRVLTDYVYKATVYDLIVHKAHRNRGLGEQLMDALMSLPELSRVEHFDLYCLPEMTAFYEKWGFSTSLGDLRHMRRTVKPDE